MKRSLRHPFRNPRYLRPERDRAARRKAPRQPKLHQNRFSVEGVLDAPDSSASRPGLRIRIVGLVVFALFGILALRLWTLQVLQAPAAAQAVTANQIRAVPVTPTRGLILDRYGNPLVDNKVVEQLTLSRVAATQYPAVVGRLAALIGETTAQVQASIGDKSYSIYKPVPILTNAPLADILYVREHPSEFPGVSSVATTERSYPRASCPVPPPPGTRRPRPSATSGPSTPQSSSPGRRRGTRRGIPTARVAWSSSTRPSCAARRAPSSWRWTRRARWWGP